LRDAPAPPISAPYQVGDLVTGVSAELRVLGGLGRSSWDMAAGRGNPARTPCAGLLHARMQGMDPDDYSIIVPPGFDDSDDEAQVHPMARRLFPGRTPAEVFAKAQQWVGKHDLTVVDVSWKSWHDEPDPFTLAVYFTFEYNPYEEDEPAGA
jgi:hypothetical protein